MLGGAVVGGLLAEGWRVRAASRREPAQLGAWSSHHEGRIEWDAVDLERPEAGAEWVRAVRKQHGRVDALVNNAAVAADGLFTLQSSGEIHHQLAVNLE